MPTYNVTGGLQAAPILSSTDAAALVVNQSTVYTLTFGDQGVIVNDPKGFTLPPLASIVLNDRSESKQDWYAILPTGQAAQVAVIPGASSYFQSLNIVARTITILPGGEITGTNWVLNQLGFSGGVQTEFITANGQTYNPNNGAIIRSGSGPTGLGGTSFSGLIMTPGQLDGQVIEIYNISGTANLTFAAAGSNVAGGNSNVISPISASGFVWSAIDNLWYPL